MQKSINFIVFVTFIVGALASPIALEPNIVKRETWIRLGNPNGVSSRGDSLRLNYGEPTDGTFPDPCKNTKTCNLRLIGAGHVFEWQDTDYGNPNSVNYRTDTLNGTTFHVLEFDFGEKKPQFCSVDTNGDGKKESNYKCIISLEASPFKT